jgi:hypothetical protein
MLNIRLLKESTEISNIARNLFKINYLKLYKIQQHKTWIVKKTVAIKIAKKIIRE